MKKNMKFNFLFKSFILGLSIVLFASCDKDFNEIGSSVIGDDHYGFSKFTESSVVAYNYNSGVVQTNNLPINALGVNDNPVFGKTTSSFVTQLEMASVNPTFYNTNIEIDSVYLYVPYYSTLVQTDTNGDSTFSLDSVYGGSSKIKLRVYESNKFLRSLDPDSALQESQKYYSDQGLDISSSIVGNYLNNSTNLSQNDDFSFSNEEIHLHNSAGATSKRLIPGIYMDLDKEFFKSKIINAPAGKLLNNNVFKDYFRGLYFEAENNADASQKGAMAMLNFGLGTITIVFHDQLSSTVSTNIRKAYVLNLKGNTINLHKNDNNATNGNYVSALSNNIPDDVSGDEKLYLKGQEGSISAIELFGTTDVLGYDEATKTLTTGPNGVSDEIDQIKNNKWLINEANLTFYIDKDAMGSTPEPNRIYLYDLKNGKPLVDYFYDSSTSTNGKFDKYVHGGIIQKESDGRGAKYKVRITHHIRNLIKYKDSTNVKLGLVITENINDAKNYYLKNNMNLSDVTNKNYIPYMAIINPLGTVLYGTNTNVPADKRLKLEIYYTKPD